MYTYNIAANGIPTATSRPCTRMSYDQKTLDTECNALHLAHRAGQAMLNEVFEWVVPRTVRPEYAMIKYVPPPAADVWR